MDEETFGVFAVLFLSIIATLILFIFLTIFGIFPKLLESVRNPVEKYIMFVGLISLPPAIITYIITRERDMLLVLIYLIPIIIVPSLYFYFADQIHSFVILHVAGGNEKFAQFVEMLIISSYFLGFFYPYNYFWGRYFERREKRRRKKRVRK